VVEPVTDLSLQEIRLLSEGGDSEVRLLLSIRNSGTLPLENFPIRLTVDQLLNISEVYEGRLEPGEQVAYPLDFSLSGQLNQRNTLRYVCVTLGTAGEDAQPSNNRACTSLGASFSILSPFPNPTNEAFEVSLVLPGQENVQMQLISTAGALLKDLTFTDTRAGLNTFVLDVAEMVSGTYLLRISYRNESSTYRLQVGP
jgi:hypothetical protein